MASYGGELGYQAPLWVAYDMKLFAKQGIGFELIRIAGGSRSMSALSRTRPGVAKRRCRLRFKCEFGRRRRCYRGDVDATGPR